MKRLAQKAFRLAIPAIIAGMALTSCAEDDGPVTPVPVVKRTGIDVKNFDLSVLTFRQTKTISKVKNCTLGKQIRLFKAIKHQRDKQIIFAYLAGIVLLKGKTTLCQISISFEQFDCIDIEGVASYSALCHYYAH